MEDQYDYDAKEIGDRLSLYIVPEKSAVHIYYAYTPREWDRKEHEFKKELEAFMSERGFSKLSDDKQPIKLDWDLKEEDLKPDPDEPSITQQVIIKLDQIDEVIEYLKKAKAKLYS